jgi:N-sulfoglucosamine sulfohydrolase
MERRDFLKTVTYGTAALLTGCAPNEDQVKRSRPLRRMARDLARKDRPNILWLISEDTCPDLACCGNRQVKTPNLDKLASEGALFTNAFVTAPVCSPSRSAFMTGMYQTSIGAHNHRSHRNDTHTLPTPAMLLTEYFRRAGYFRCNCAGLNYKQSGKTDWNFMTMALPFDGTDWSQRRTGQPFFAQINFSLTHRNFRRDKKNPINPDKVELPPYYPDHPLARRDWADYLESIQLLDTEIGVALRWLEKEGMAENTIVMYFADNGRPHVRGKQWLYEGGIHVPMMIRWPGHLEPGTVVDDLISTVDFGPTFLSMAGIGVPLNMQGRVFVNAGKKRQKYVFAARDRCDGTVDRIRCVRSVRYKYIRNYRPEQPYTQFNAYKKLQYPMLTLMEVLHAQGRLTPDQEKFMAPARPKEELYDLQEDPHELHNLAEDPKLARVLKEHRKKLDEWIKGTGDQGEEPEDPQVVAACQDEMMESYKQGMADRGLSPRISDEEYLKWWEKKLLG